MANTEIESLNEASYESYIEQPDKIQSTPSPEILILDSGSGQSWEGAFNLILEAHPDLRYSTRRKFPDGIRHGIPRGLPWSRYPVTPRPIWISSRSIRQDQDTVEDERGDRVQWINPEVSQRLDNIKVIVVRRRSALGLEGASRSEHDYWLGQTLRVLQAELRHVPLVGVEVGAPGFWYFPSWDAAISDLSLAFEPSDRLRYHYTVNGGALFSRVFSHLVDDAQKAYGLGQKLAEQPLILQMLYKIAREGCQCQRQPQVFARLDAEGKALPGNEVRWIPVGFPGFDILNDAPLKREVYRGSTLSWKGTGKYPPVTFHAQSVDWIFFRLCFDFIEVSAHGLATATDFCRRFLAALPPDCEDPDILLRWRDPATGFIRPGSEPAVDAWTRRFFGKMKDKVDRVSWND